MTLGVEHLELLSELRSVVARHGCTRLLEARLVEPTPECFPDAWSADEPGVLALARRVFGYAGLDGGSIKLVPWRSQAKEYNRTSIGRGDDDVRVTEDPFGPACLQQYDGNECIVGIDFDDLEYPAMVAAALCRVAALVFATGRDPYRDPPQSDPTDVNVLRTADIITVYLGLGILTANDAARFFRATSASGRRNTQVHRTAGVLPYDAMTFLLAVQVTARKLSASDRRHVRSLLDANQQATFKEHLRALENEPPVFE